MKVLQIAFLVFGLVILTNAQKTTLRGTIFDFNGAVIPGAKIQIKDLNANNYLSFSNGDGEYKFDLPEGFYAIEISAHGFKKSIFKKYWIATKFTKKMFLDIVLETSGEVIEHKIYPEKKRKKTIIK